jgi:hypothetical protein
MPLYPETFNRCPQLGLDIALDAYEGMNKLIEELNEKRLELHSLAKTPHRLRDPRCACGGKD